VPGGVWDFFPNQIEYHKHVPSYDAYPSGHIATAMATVTVVAENYPEWKWVRPVGYVIVGLIGVSMANTGIHWYSDFPLGIALGYCFGMIVSHPEGLPIETKAEGDSPTVSVAPVLDARGRGLGVVMSF
jgi:membrane-associated phospholipid phosphatase